MSEPLDVGELIVTEITLPPPELHVLRKQTKAFIYNNPMNVAIIRSTLEPDGAGGVNHVITTLEVQIMRLITQLSPGEGLSRMSEDGIETRPDFVLLGFWDADVVTHDYFFKDGRKYELIYVREDRRYETWSEVAYRG